MDNFQKAYTSLNSQQRQAVDTIDGPVLVIAGPGTGKTQLLTTRIANILDKTDSLPENILCLTFTESAAHTMRERLSSIIPGNAAYNVTISTYHAFGSELMRRYREYFNEQPGMQAIDELGIDIVLRQIISHLPYGNPLKFADSYIGDVKSTLSDFKRALLGPEDIRQVAAANIEFINFVTPVVREHLKNVSRMDKGAITQFAALAVDTQTFKQPKISDAVYSLQIGWQRELEAAVSHAEETGKTTELTKWKNTWLAKNDGGSFIPNGRLLAEKLQAFAGVYEAYLEYLTAHNLFDYDDMILRAIRGLEEHTDLRYTLQEQYLYILLDEFQDTNAAQLRLVELLTDNPVNEGRPNVLAVGDDDQAIYAFQGADYSHMLAFAKRYKEVKVIPLVENYRSSKAVLDIAEGISGQIAERLHYKFTDIDKSLVASNQSLPAATIQQLEFKTDMGQYAWIAKKAAELVAGGTPAHEIAVIAPQHRYLEPLVPYLHQEKLAVYYEKRENILEDPLITELLRMSQLVLALAAQQSKTASSLWAEILSYNFWQLPTSFIWQLSWEADDSRSNWTDILLSHEETKVIALFFIRLSLISGTETLETMLDYLVGVKQLDLLEPSQPAYTSPYYQYYFDGSIEGTTTTAEFWQLLSNMTVLRAHLHEYKADSSIALSLADLIEFVIAHDNANIKILNTSPYQEATEAVQLMTAYKAKGQEFSAVFVVACLEEVWGPKARTQTSNITLPTNLQFVRYAGATADERLRLFYVALTRAKNQLFLTGYAHNFAGKTMTRLSFLAEKTTDTGTLISPLLPVGSQEIIQADVAAPDPAALSANWHSRHLAPYKLDLQALLGDRLRTFQLSPTHVNCFTDLLYNGPASFFIDILLRFPVASTPEGQYGNAMHETIEWIHDAFRQRQSVPSLAQVTKILENRLLQKRLSEQLTAQLIDRGIQALTAYLKQREGTIRLGTYNEYSFRNEGVFIGQAHMAGKIDKLIVDKAHKTITIVDYKTGKSYSRWQNLPKLHMYKQQLYLYKTLVEHSRSFRGYTVTDAYLEFVEPNEYGRIEELHLSFDGEEEAAFRALTEAVWNHVQKLSFPDTSAYTADLKGIQQFERDLIQGTI